MSRRPPARTILVTSVIVATLVPVVGSAQIDGFTTPYRSVDVATAETGVVSQILVREGDVVQQGQILAKLDDQVHVSLLAAAEQQMKLKGRAVVAQAELRLRQVRLRKLQELQSRGSARQEEVDRAQADMDIAQGQLLATREELQLKRLDYQRAKIQLQRRTLRAPMSGVVTRLFKEEGEFIGPNDPQLLTIVQLDPLLATFSVPSEQARRMHVSQSVNVRLLDTHALAKGNVEFLAPVVDGKSGTMRVKVRLDNPQRRHFSGEPCALIVPNEASQRPAPDVRASIRSSSKVLSPPLD